MAVLVAKEPERVYQSLGSLGSTKEERKRADKLDRLLGRRIKSLIKDLKRKRLAPKKAGQGDTKTYWEVGRVLRDVADGSGLLDKAELPLFWQNAKMYIPEELRYKERGPYREHLLYCYRLAGYPAELANRMSWGEWVTIFDSTGINQELRFDGWFKTKLSQSQERLSRSWIRLFAPCVNSMLGNIYTHDLTDTELFSCYEAAWQIVRKTHERKEKQGSPMIGRKEIQASVKSNLRLLGAVMEGNLSAHKYSSTILADASG